MAQQCKTSDISVSQRLTGRKVPAGPEYEVFVKNNCACAQFNLVVACPGFNSNTAVDPRWLQNLGGGNCLVNSGYAVIRGSPVHFFYDSTSQFSLSPKKSDVRC